MKQDRLIPGAMLVIIGALFLLNNFNVINFDWYTFIHLWPIILIIAGVNLVFAHNRTGWATAIKLAVLILGMGILIWSGVTRHNYHHFDFTFDDNDRSNDDNDDDSDTTGSKGKNTGNFVEAYKPAIQTAHLTISGGATGYSIKDTSRYLFEAETEGKHSNYYSLTTTIDSTLETLKFSMGKGKHHGFTFNFGDKGHSGKAKLKLNIRPVWDIDVEGGMAAYNFDLSPYKVKNLSFKGGMASCDVKMGQPVGLTNVEFHGGMASFSLKIPQNAACHIKTGTALSSKNFEGFNKTGDSDYETPGYSQATNKIDINIKGGMSEFNVTRY
ncbi:hypothetical protein KXQ82_14750 [Mucilaginibacter sp. HMF5004]|uniref:LiaI-LiaF-like domain-containing protein n=1 Tax=Mucilaginibacter rivuli TaxID=2857527 RepID=UPI001C5FCA14|nr:DUF5668 domain-containing protein [Mucilaginibacter rivuli]MBW4890984.1 hypothetical protein [Mucilaginibacter rivuli]